MAVIMTELYAGAAHNTFEQSCSQAAKMGWDEAKLGSEVDSVGKAAMRRAFARHRQQLSILPARSSLLAGTPQQPTTKGRMHES
jgi:hypothetical protein